MSSLKTDMKSAYDKMDMVPLALSFFISWGSITTYLNVAFGTKSTCIPKLVGQSTEDDMKRVLNAVLIIGTIVSVTDVVVHVAWSKYKKTPILWGREGLSFIQHYFASFIVVYLYAAGFGICTNQVSLFEKIKDSGAITMFIYLVSFAIRFALHLLHIRKENFNAVALSTPQ